MCVLLGLLGVSYTSFQEGPYTLIEIFSRDVAQAFSQDVAYSYKDLLKVRAFVTRSHAELLQRDLVQVLLGYLVSYRILQNSSGKIVQALSQDLMQRLLPRDLLRSQGRDLLQSSRTILYNSATKTFYKSHHLPSPVLLKEVCTSIQPLFEVPRQYVNQCLGNVTHQLSHLSLRLLQAAAAVLFGAAACGGAGAFSGIFTLAPGLSSCEPINLNFESYWLTVAIQQMKLRRSKEFQRYTI